MTTIRATCGTCGDVELTTADVQVMISEESGEGTYSFRCPHCEAVVVKGSPRHTIDLLVSAGVRYSTWVTPAEAPLDQQRYRKGAFFPYDLQTLTHRPTWAEWQLYDRSTSEGARTAVDNWLRYGERLSFLVNLFRSRQQVTSLYDTPRSTPSATPPRPAALGPALEHLSDVTKERLANSFRGSS